MSQRETLFVSSDGRAELLIFEKHSPHCRRFDLHQDGTEKIEDAGVDDDAVKIASVKLFDQLDSEDSFAMLQIACGKPRVKVCI